MKVSHIIYKVQDLHKGVEEFRSKGFAVEYGKDKNPYNALIYFSEGPYLELLGKTGMPSIIKKVLRLSGKGKLADRLDFWDNHAGGPCGLALENYRTELEDECEILKKYGYGCVQMNSMRNDTKGRKLRFKAGYPDDIQIPFFMTYFNIDPKPRNFVHPNGAVKIKHVTFGTRRELFPLINEMCDDEILEVCEGSGLQGMELEYLPGRENI